MGTGKALVSIVVPVYQTEEYLPQCIEGLLEQTYRQIEVLLVDDGSSDSSGELCDWYAAQDDRITVIHQCNQGVSAARNVGIQAAEGIYIAFVDSDDWVDANYIEEMVQLLEQNGADAAIAMSHGKTVNVWSGAEALRHLCYQKHFDTAPWGKLFRSELVKATLFPEGMFFEDLAVVCRMIGSANRVVAARGSHYHYRVNPAGTMNGGDVVRLLDELRAADQMYEYVEKRLNSGKKAAVSRKFSAYCQVLLKLPENGYVEERGRIWQYLREVRWDVLWDSQARMKNRVAAMVSYLGESAMRRIWSVAI